MNQDTDKAGPFTVRQERDAEGNKHRATATRFEVEG